MNREKGLGGRPAVPPAKKKSNFQAAPASRGTLLMAKSRENQGLSNLTDTRMRELKSRKENVQSQKQKVDEYLVQQMHRDEREYDRESVASAKSGASTSSVPSSRPVPVSSSMISRPLPPTPTPTAATPPPASLPPPPPAHPSRPVSPRAPIPRIVVNSSGFFKPVQNVMFEDDEENSGEDEREVVDNIIENMENVNDPVFTAPVAPVAQSKKKKAQKGKKGFQGEKAKTDPAVREENTKRQFKRNLGAIKDKFSDLADAMKEGGKDLEVLVVVRNMIQSNKKRNSRQLAQTEYISFGSGNLEKDFMKKGIRYNHKEYFHCDMNNKKEQFVEDRDHISEILNGAALPVVPDEVPVPASEEEQVHRNEVEEDPQDDQQDPPDMSVTGPVMRISKQKEEKKRKRGKRGGQKHKKKSLFSSSESSGSGSRSSSVSRQDKQSVHKKPKKIFSAPLISDDESSDHSEHGTRVRGRGNVFRKSSKSIENNAAKKKNKVESNNRVRADLLGSDRKKGRQAGHNK